MLDYWFSDDEENAPDATSEIPFGMRRYSIPYAIPLYVKGTTCSYLQQVFRSGNIEMEHVHFSMIKKTDIRFGTRLPAFLFYFVLEGKSHITFDTFDKPLVLKTKAYFFHYIQAHGKHALHLREGEYTVLYFLLPMEAIDKITKENPALGLEQNVDDVVSGTVFPEIWITNIKMKRNLGEIILAKAGGVRLEMLLKARLLDLLYEYLENRLRPIQIPSLSKNDTNRFETLKTYILDNLDKPLNNKLLARLYGKNIVTFKRDFSYYFKIPPYAFIKRERLLLAKKMVLQTREPINSIALSVGYNDITGFNRSFKKMFGNTPVWFRKNEGGLE